jgi:hypothetical protein
MFAVKLFSTRVVSDKNNLKIFFSIGGFGFMVFNATLNNISVISSLGDMVPYKNSFCVDLKSKIEASTGQL